MLLTRAMFEGAERERLAPYAMCSRDSRGRDHSEQEAPYRSRFARDRDRIVHAKAFRRLEYKTQVFVNTEGDHYRTRLTHTLEVAQIGRSIARALQANEDLVEAIALAHDLGHTPFGNAGEEALNELMSGHGGFDHNWQGLRIVEELETRYPNFPGLNLTWEVREGMIKHETDYDRSAFEGFDPHLRGTVEAQIVNVADEIAYNSHDLDDGLRAGILRPAMLAGQPLWDQAVARFGHTSGGDLPDMVRYGAARNIIRAEVEGVVEETDRCLRTNGIESVEAVRTHERNVVGFSPELEMHNRQLKDCLLNNFYMDYRLVRRTMKARQIIERMFQAYCTEPRQLPELTQTYLEERDLYRVVCDYIAGMTDRYAAQEYGRLFDVSEWM